MTVANIMGGLSWWRYVRNKLTNSQLVTSRWAEQYNYLDLYYGNNGLYDDLRQALVAHGVNVQLVKPLRNPAYRVVEFYAAKIWPGTLPGALPITTKNKNLIVPIERIWVMSNWNSEKQATARITAKLGDLFIKVASVGPDGGPISRVYLQNVDPGCVTDMSVDERSFLTYIRIDIPGVRRDDKGTPEKYYTTEIWDKNTGIMRRWVHKLRADASIEALGQPQVIKSFESMGVDFIPVVWQPFKHIGQERGQASFTPGIDKIDEVNAQATRLHQMLFRYNKPLFVASSEGKDASGRDIPPPRFAGSDGSKLTLATDPNAEDIVRLSNTQRLDALIPSINFSAHLDAINAQMNEIAQDLPEMIYSRLQDRTDLSGVAIRYLLEAAIDKLQEARGNLDSSLVRAQQMALTIGVAGGLFADLGGDYASGALDHTFSPRPVLNLPEKERAELIQIYTTGGVPIEIAAKRAGWSEDEVIELVEAKKKADAEAQRTLAQSLLDAQGNLNQDDSPQAPADTATEDDTEV